MPMPKYLLRTNGYGQEGIRDPHALEYNIFKIPKPNATFILKTSSEWAKKLAPKITEKNKKKKREAYLGNKKRDIHEENLAYLYKKMNNLQLAKRFFMQFMDILGKGAKRKAIKLNIMRN